MALVGLTDLCPPATLYLVLSLLAIILMAMQNFGTSDRYCIGIWSCPNSNTTTIFLVKLLFVVFYTWILNIICKHVTPIVSWVLVLTPILLMFLGISLTLMQHVDWARYPANVQGYVRS
jgi:hypothetical protein